MKRVCLSAAIAALFSSPVYGQVFEIGKNCRSEQIHAEEWLQDISCYPDSDIISVGRRISHTRASDMTAPVSAINEEEIIARGNAYVADLLRIIAGVSVNRSGPQGGLTQIRVRGSEANHVLVLVDGIEASNPNTGEFDFSTLRSEDVIRIEVLRGEQSALWGSDAIGGVINIITRAGKIDEGYSLSLEGGSFGTFETQASAVIPVGTAALSIHGNIFTTEGYDVSGRDGEKDGANSRAINVGLNNIKLGAVSLSGKLSTNRAHSKFDSDTDFNGRLDNTDAELETNTDTGRISARFNTAGFDNLINVSLTNTQQDTTGTSFPNDTTGKRTQVNWAAEKSLGSHNITFLAETEKENFSNFGGIGAFQNQEESISNHALAGDYRYHNSTLTLTASARRDFNDRFKNSATWRVGAGYKVETLNGRVRASVGTGVKNPSMTELFGFFPSSFVGNAALTPETSIGYSLGYDQEFLNGDIKLNADYFHSKLENEIFTVFNPDFTSTVRNNTARSTREGAEFELRAHINNALSMRASATFLTAKENETLEVRRPKFLASTTVTWAPTEHISLTLFVDHTGRQIDLDFADFPAARVELDAFTLIGLNARYKYNEEITLYVRGDNLLNESYQEIIGYTSQGRGIYAGLSADF